MKDNTKDFMQFLIDKKEYNLIELPGNNQLPNIWCLSKAYMGEQYYLVFTDERTHNYSKFYREYILSRTVGINEPINIYEVLTCANTNFEYPHNSLIFINFKEEIIKVSTKINRDIALHMEEAFNYNVSRKNEKKNLLKDNKGTSIILLANIIIYLISFMVNVKSGGGIMDIDISVLYKLGGLVNISMVGSEFYRFITNIFLHGGLVHLGFNMYALLSLGPMVEMVYGRKKFFIIYFVSGIFGSFITSFTLEGVAIGASGAIFGLLGATLIVAYKAKNVIGKSFLFNIISVIGVNIVIGVSLPNISNTAHMAGLVIGMIVSIFMFIYKNNK